MAFHQQVKLNLEAALEGNKILDVLQLKPCIAGFFLAKTIF